MKWQTAPDYFLTPRFRPRNTAAILTQHIVLFVKKFPRPSLREKGIEKERDPSNGCSSFKSAGCSPSNQLEPGCLPTCVMYPREKQPVRKTPRFSVSRVGVKKQAMSKQRDRSQPLSHCFMLIAADEVGASFTILFISWSFLIMLNSHPSIENATSANVC